MTDPRYELVCAYARENPAAYSVMLWPEEPPDAHHKLILSALHEAVTGRGPRNVVIEAPPGSAKSLTASIRFASWVRGLRPEWDIIASSHTQELANKFGRRVRNTCAMPEWEDIWALAVADDSAAVNRWSVSREGKALSEYFAAGVGTNVVGRRAMLYIGDDVAGGVADALESKIERERVWDWYKGDLLPRLKPGAVQVHIGTRFHEEDYLGRVKQDAAKNPDRYRVICLPMEAGENDVLGRKPGERLWGGYFDDEMVARAKEDMNTWLALYQQRPLVESGQYFRREWLRYYDKRPEHLQIYGASDYAVSDGIGDYTVHMVFGVNENDDLYVLDVWRGQAATDTWIDEWLKLVHQWKPLEWAEEKGQIEKSVGPFLTKRCLEERIYCYRRGFASTKDKSTRAQAIRGRFAQGKVYFPRNAPWLATLIEEMMAFPLDKASIHDDMVDCLSLAGRQLAGMAKARIPEHKVIDLNKEPTFSEVFWAEQERPWTRV